MRALSYWEKKAIGSKFCTASIFNHVDAEWHVVSVSKLIICSYRCNWKYGYATSGLLVDYYIIPWE